MYAITSKPQNDMTDIAVLSVLSDFGNGKSCPKLPKTSKQHDRHCCDIPVVKFGQVPHQMQCF